MFHSRGGAHEPRGQMVVLFAVVLSLVLFAVGLVIDGGNGLAQRRAAQNSSDFAAMAGARIIAEFIGGDTTNGTDANVVAAIQNSVDNNGGEITFGAPDGPQYVDSNGNLLGYVGTGTLPPTAAGVKVRTSRDWRPFFLGVFGISSWATSADATAKGGFCTGCAPDAGTLFPAAISTAHFEAYPFCSGPVSTDPTSECYPQQLTPGNTNVPGGFGWLAYGCDGYGLGQEPPANAGGCQNNEVFLDEEIGPPSKSYGCCTVVGLPGSLDQIESLPGNKASAECDYYIDNEITVTVPIWDVAGGTGEHGWYHIVGFAGFQITGCDGGKNLAGVWRQAFWEGPVSTTPSYTGVPQALGIQLVR